MFRSQPLWQKMQAFQHKVQQLSTMEICNVLLATGLGLLIIGKFERLIMTSIIGMTTSMCGSIVLLVGVAVFVAIARSVLDYEENQLAVRTSVHQLKPEFVQTRRCFRWKLPGLLVHG